MRFEIRLILAFVLACAASGCLPLMPLAMPAMNYQPVYTPDRDYHNHVELARQGCDDGSKSDCERYRVLVEDCMRRIGPSGSMWTWHEPTWADRRACEGI